MRGAWGACPETIGDCPGGAMNDIFVGLLRIRLSLSLIRVLVGIGACPSLEEVRFSASFSSEGCSAMGALTGLDEILNPRVPLVASAELRRDDTDDELELRWRLT